MLGCGGTLLRRRAESETVAWLLMTAISEEAGWTTQQIEKRAAEIGRVERVANPRRPFLRGWLSCCRIGLRSYEGSRRRISSC